MFLSSFFGRMARSRRALAKPRDRGGGAPAQGLDDDAVARRGDGIAIARRAENSADRITLTGLGVFGRHGVLDRERAEGQDFVVDIVAWLDLGAAARSDDLAKTVHYGEMAQLAADVVGGEPRDLIESVAGTIADEVLAAWPLHAVEVTVHKPSAPIPLSFDDVAVTVRRESGGVE